MYYSYSKKKKMYYHDYAGHTNHERYTPEGLCQTNETKTTTGKVGQTSPVEETHSAPPRLGTPRNTSARDPIHRALDELSHHSRVRHHRREHQVLRDVRCAR